MLIFKNKDTLSSVFIKIFIIWQQQPRLTTKDMDMQRPKTQFKSREIEVDTCVRPLSELKTYIAKMCTITEL